MRRFCCVLLSLLSLCTSAALGQESYRFTGSSNLPLLIIDTDGKPVPNEPKGEATLSVIDHADGRPNSLTDKPTLRSRIRIETRGSSSQQFEKKSYRLETVDKKGEDKDFPLLGLPKDSDWVLYGPYSDKSLMRNHLAYHLSNQMGFYAPRTAFAELFLRDSDKPVEEQYVGVYVLVESIKRGKDRVNIGKLQKDEAKGFIGGYVLKTDRVEGPETYITSELGSVLGLVSPRGDKLTEEQRAWIIHDYSRFEHAISGRDFLDPKKGYAQFIDMDSYINYFLISELFKNVDAYFLSTFMNRTDDGLLHLGPLWDFDLTSGNASYGGVWNTKGWMLFSDEPRRMSGVPFWWDRLFQDPKFRARMLERWKFMKKEQLGENGLFAKIDETSKRLEAAQKRNFERWPTLGKYVWPNPRPYPKTYAEEVKKLKTWLSNRIEWMDANLENVGK